MTLACHNCNASNPDGAQFCNNCGAKLETQQASAKPTSLPEQTASDDAADPVGTGWSPTHAVGGQVPESLPEVAGTQPWRKREPETRRVVEGEVRGFDLRSEPEGQSSVTVWSFRVESYDRAGNRRQPVPVEMRGKKFKGAIKEGDTVHIKNTWREGNTLRVKKLYNLTTHTNVEAKASTLLLQNVIFFIIAGVLLLAFCWAINSAASGVF